MRNLDIVKATSWLVAALLTVFSTLSYSAVIATVSQTQVAKGEIILLKITSDQKADSSDIDFSVLQENFYTGTPSFGSSYQNINGQSSVRSEWSLSLAPLRAGILTIPSFSLNGENTKAIDITATIDPSAPQPDELVDISSSLEKPSLYLGEVTLLNTKLTIKTDIRQLRDPAITPPSSSDPLTLEPIGEAKQYRTVINGIEATVVEQSYRVSATAAGHYSISTPKFSALVVDRGNGRSNARLVPIAHQSSPLDIEIMEKPAHVSGEWIPASQLTLRQQWFDENGELIGDSTRVNTTVGAPITREITLSVQGTNLANLPNIAPDYPETVRLYSEPVKTEQTEDQITMTLKQVIIPKSEGEIVLPELSLNWWNTKVGEQNTAQLDGLKLISKKSELLTLALNTSDTSDTLRNSDLPPITHQVSAGYWPYISLFFALLWLMTLWYAIKNHTKSLLPIQEEEKAASDVNPKQLIAAIKLRDGVAFQSLMNKWYDENSTLDPTDKGEITQESEMMMKEIYSPVNGNWDDTKLIKLITKARKNQKRQPESPLASL